MSINDIIGLWTKIPNCVNVIEFISILVLFGLVLGTEALDEVLRTKGVENFGAFLTVFFDCRIFNWKNIDWFGRRN